MGQMIDAVAEGVAFNFLMDGERATLFIVAEFHLRSVVTGLAFDEIADSGVFYNHFGPERVSGESEKIGALVGGDFNYNVGPAGQNMLSI